MNEVRLRDDGSLTTRLLPQRPVTVSTLHTKVPWTKFGPI